MIAKREGEADIVYAQVPSIGTSGVEELIRKAKVSDDPGINGIAEKQ